MPYRKEIFDTGKIYHIVLRGIDDNKLYKDTDDYYRGIFSIYEFNNIAGIEIRERRRERLKSKAFSKLSGNPTSANLDRRDKLVEVLAFCPMPNHIHLLVRQLKDGGIIKFMKKFGGGYAKYFNLKYGRKGYVFQNRFLAVPIKTDEQLKSVTDREFMLETIGGKEACEKLVEDYIKYRGNVKEFPGLFLE